MKPSQFQKYIGVAATLMVFAACGSEQAKDTPEGGDGSPASEAGTDAVPAQPTAELPAANTPTTPAPAEPAAPTSAAPAADPGQPDTYTVKPGDTLMKIAFEVYGDVYKWKEVYEANKDKIKDPNIVSSQVVLKVVRPGNPVNSEQNGEKYLIKEGDTLGKISHTVYGTTAKWKDLWESNKQLIHDPNRIFAGFYLYYNTTSSVGSTSPHGSTPESSANTGASNTSVNDAGVHSVVGAPSNGSNAAITAPAASALPSGSPPTPNATNDIPPPVLPAQ